jgi:hypothetical protein
MVDVDEASKAQRASWWPGCADDGKRIAHRADRLHPGLHAVGAIGRAATLGHDTFEAVLACDCDEVGLRAIGARVGAAMDADPVAVEDEIANRVDEGMAAGI